MRSMSSWQPVGASRASLVGKKGAATACGALGALPVHNRFPSA